MARLRNYGWDCVKLAELSFEELNTLRLSVENDPASKNPAYAAGKSICLFTKAAMRKTDAIGWAIYHKQQAAKADAA